MAMAGFSEREDLRSGEEVEARFVRERPRDRSLERERERLEYLCRLGSS